MALTRKLLQSMGLTDEQVSAIIENHSETVEGLKAERDQHKAAAEAAQSAARERDELRKQVEALQASGGDAAKVQADFDAYRQQVETEKANAAKSAAVRKTLKDSGVAREEFLELLLGKVDLSKVEMEGEAIKDAAALVDPLKTSYSGCFAQELTGGTPPIDPPAGGNKTYTRDQLRQMSPAEINRNWDAIKGNLASLK